MTLLYALPLLLLALVGCSSETATQTPPTSPTVPLATATSATFEATTTSSPASGPLSVTWVPRLTSLALESCRGTPFTPACLADSIKLQTAAIDLGKDAESRGMATVKTAADRVVSELDRWVQECSITTAGTPARTKCLSLIMQLPQQNEDLIEAIYAAEQK